MFGIVAHRRLLLQLALIQFIVTAVLAAVFSGCGTEPEEDVDTVVLAENSHNLDDDPNVHLSVLGTTTLVLDFTGEAPAIAADDVVWGGEQGGYLRRVVSVTTHDSTLVLLTENATFDELIEHGRVHARETVDPWTAVAKLGGEATFADEMLPGTTIDESGVHFADTELFDGILNGVHLTVAIPEGRLQFAPTYELDAGFDAGGCTDLTIRLDGEIELQLVVTVQVSDALEHTQVVEAVAPLTNVVVPLLPPLDLVLEMHLETGFELRSATGDVLTGGIEGRCAVGLGAEWTRDDGWLEIWQPAPEFQALAVQWDASGDTELRGFVRPVVTSAIGTAAGPSLTVEPFLVVGAAGIAADWGWRLRAGTGASLVYEDNIFSQMIDDYAIQMAEALAVVAADSSSNPEDHEPPADIVDLVSVAETTSTITIQWTAPGDDGHLGRAAQYDLRYSSYEIDEANWVTAAPFALPPPAISGTPETTSITDLEPQTTYYVALKTADDRENWSGLSNLCQATTLAVVPDAIPPAPVLDLAVTGATANSVSLRWTATGDDGLDGTASRYDLRYSQNFITDANWDAASRAGGEPLPAPPGSEETFTLIGLNPITAYYIALRVRDDSNNRSTLSNVCVALTDYDSPPPPPPAGFALSLAGTFTMGSPENEPGRGVDEIPHTVVLSRHCYVQTTEVTNQQYLELAQWAVDQGYASATETTLLDALDGSSVELLDLDSPFSELAFDTDSELFSLRDAGHGSNPDHPVKAVSWFGAASYCDWLSLQEGFDRAYDHSDWSCNDGQPYGAEGYRLPTEAEWEYACRAGNQTAFCNGDITYLLCDLDPVLTQVAWYCGNAGNWTHPVAQKDANSWGLYDMHGNVWEWCNDWHGSYDADPITDPIGAISGEARTWRGGTWAFTASWCRSAKRGWGHPEYSESWIGFRPVRPVNR